MKINTAGHFITGSFLALPPVISVLVNLSGITLPSYLTISLIGMILIGGLIPKATSITVRKIGIVSITYILYFSLAIINTFSEQNLSSPYDKLVLILYILCLPIFLIIVTFSLESHAEKCSTEKANEVYFQVFKFSNVVFFVLFLLFSYQEYGRYLMPGIDNPIWVSRHLGAGILVYIFYLLTVTCKNRSLHYLLLILMLLVFLISGSRAPVGALAITFFMMLWLTGNSTRSKVLIFLAITFAIGTLVIFAQDTYILSLNPWSLYHRYEQFSFVLQSPLSFFGNGFSSFGPLYLEEDVIYYPHNIFAELYFEFGIVGLFLICGLIFQLRPSVINSAPGFLVIYFLINAMFSGDVIGNVSLFIALIGAVNIYSNKKWALRNTLLQAA